MTHLLESVCKCRLSSGLKFMTSSKPSYLTLMFKGDSLHRFIPDTADCSWHLSDGPHLIFITHFIEEINSH